MQESELRQDRTNGRWVIIAPNRWARPGAHATGTRTGSDEIGPSFCATCPFCPGNEAQLPGIIAETRVGAAPEWSVRIVPNKYPALQAAAGERGNRNGENRRDGYGFHEVIIESPFHNAALVSMGDEQLDAVIAVYRSRCNHLMAQPTIEAVTLFRNQGPGGGASLSHPHAQVLALGVVPPNVALLTDWGQRYHAEHGRCPTCDEIERERALAQRVIEDSQNFTVIVPFAAEHPFETWIVPKQHQASFLALRDAHQRELGSLLRRTLRRLCWGLDNPAYNFVVDSAGREHLDAPYVHWRLRIVPDLTKRGGFELASGMFINPSSPEEDAAILRSAAQPNDT